MRRALPCLLVMVLAPVAARGALPTAIGHCVRTKVAHVMQRLEDGQTHRAIPGSGSAIEFSNGGYQVSYDEVPAVNGARPGDPVVMCLVSIPRHCPKGDDRGRIYTSVDLRSLQIWTLPDAEHACGGA
ncbi:MAG: hypothetical protein KGI51_06340 [Rhodospirillales bacterium]|nr:hypothetical protein [Rhodospirillales bacterium]